MITRDRPTKHATDEPTTTTKSFRTISDIWQKAEKEIDITVNMILLKLPGTCDLCKSNWKERTKVCSCGGELCELCLQLELPDYCPRHEKIKFLQALLSTAKNSGIILDQCIRKNCENEGLFYCAFRKHSPGIYCWRHARLRSLPEELAFDECCRMQWPTCEQTIISPKTGERLHRECTNYAVVKQSGLKCKKHREN